MATPISADPAASRTRRWATFLVGLILATGATALPGHLREVRHTLPLLRLWCDPDAQHRRVEGAAYDFLRAADAVLPANASVLLLTSGRDVRHREYTTFHRALYLLTPRPVWWMSPAPADSTWESRWWISAPLTRKAILAIAHEKKVAHILAFELAGALPAGEKIADLPGGALFALGPRQDSAGGVAQPVSVASLWPVRLGAALVVVLMIGYCAVTILGRFDLCTTRLEAATLAWILGAGLTSIAMFWLNAWGLTLEHQVAVVTLAAIGGSATIRRFDRRRRAPSPRTPSRGKRSPVWSKLFSMLLVGLLASLILTVTVSAVGKPLTMWDSWVLWGMRARAIFVGGRISPVIYADPSRAVTLPDYPLLFPLLEAWIYTWLGAADDRLAGIAAVLFYAALPAVAYATLRRRGADRASALLATAALAAVPVLVRLAGGVLADIPVALFATVAAIHVVEWLEGRGGGALMVAALSAGLLPWTKREGTVLVAALMVATLVVGRGARRARHAALAVVTAVGLLSGPWYAFAAWRALPGPQFTAVSPARFAANLDRLPSIASQMLSALLSSDASGVWPLAVLFALLCPRSIAPLRPSVLLPMTAVLYLTCLGLAYVFSAYVPYQQHVASSFFRLAAHVVPLPLLWIAYHASPEQ